MICKVVVRGVKSKYCVVNRVKEASKTRRFSFSFFFSLFPRPMEEALTYFGAGALYGVAGVVSAQPLDTIKTVVQTSQSKSVFQIARTLGLKGLYRGSIPVLVGGSTFRSAQFGVYEAVLKMLPPKDMSGPFHYQTLVAGPLGGLARGLIEAPFEFVKVRQQVAEAWRFRDIYHGSSVTLLRNSFLFGSFVVYLDVTNYLFPQLGATSVGAFAKGAICANLAWVCIWPLDVIKSRRQSGRFTGMSSAQLLGEVIRNRQLFSGILPGLIRSTVANGFGMLAYSSFVTYMKDKRQ